MNQSKSIRLLFTKWASNTGWPKRLEWVEIDNVRGWEGQRVKIHPKLMKKIKARHIMLQEAETVTATSTRDAVETAIDLAKDGRSWEKRGDIRPWHVKENQDVPQESIPCE